MIAKYVTLLNYKIACVANTITYKISIRSCNIHWFKNKKPRFAGLRSEALKNNISYYFTLTILFVSITLPSAKSV